ncbi:type VII secretion-associated serine protease mycosin [Streptomyces sp. NRRL WC-3549]|uniref:type VII secretion-associated serine protease mycosin n=1 Tax=Streptomyces sp. NRRL WC-3549 TaxID=1463925 RepID=UPI001F2B7248|nr:type VII secretion-associated serine protease mycosin [Streptomyces sp. NRRL WC-3549]
MSQQWHLDRMGAEKMWQTSTGKGVTVAVIDTGVREVPELAGQIVKGKDFTDGHSSGHDGRGTAVAAVIAGTGKGLGGKDSAYGLAPGSKILPLKIIDRSGGGTPSPSSSEEQAVVGDQMAPAIRYAADSDAKIITISPAAERRTAALEWAVEYALTKGKLVFAAVGDSEGYRRQVQYPARIPGVVGVAALDKDRSATQTSAWGPQVDLSAPGEDILSACDEGAGLCKNSGTAVASAVAAASAALIWSVHPDWTANQVLRVMVSTASGPTTGDVRSDYIGYGIVRPLRVLQSPGDPGAAERYPLPDYTAPSAPQGAESAASVGPGSGPGTAFVVSLGVCATGLLCLAVALPLLVADRRRTRTAVSRP